MTDPSQYPAQYAKAAARYARADEPEHVALGLKALADDDRRPAKALSQNRAMLSDALREAGRVGEADLLADPKRHVVVHGGEVKPGRWNTDEVLSRFHEAADHVDEWAGGDHVGSHVPAAYTNAEWKYAGFRDEDFEEPPGPVPRHHLRLVYVDPNGYEPHTHSDVHRADLAGHLADWLDDEVNYADFGWNTDGDGAEEQGAEFDRLLQRLRDTPAEVPDEQ